MNNSTSPGGLLGSENIGGFGYGIGVSVGILLLITTITLASYYCIRNHTTAIPPLPTRRRSNFAAEPLEPPEPHQLVDIVEVGIDEATLKSYPKVLYAEAKKNYRDSTASCCSICLADYKSSDVVRSLPECGHLFHVRCVDQWLRRHPTCPVCRTSPLPSPVATPLAEVAPLARRPI